MEKQLKIKVIKSQKETEGLLSVLEVSAPAGFKNNKHTHAFCIETFRVMKGSMTLRHGQNNILLQQSEAFAVNQGIPHHFINHTDEEITFLVYITPGDEAIEKDALKNGVI